MSGRFNIRVIRSTLSMILLGCSPATGYADDPAIGAMKAALDQWLLDVEFACRYSFRSGEAESIDAGLVGDWSSVDESRSFKGVFCKGLGKSRMSITHDAPPVLVGKSGDNSEYLNVNMDEVASAEVGLSYSPSPEEGLSDGLARLEVRERLASRGNGLGRYDAGIRTKRRMTPLSIDGNEVGSYLSANGTIGQAADLTVLEITPELITIQVGFASGAYDVTKDVRFSLLYQTPIVEEVRIVMDNGAPESRFEMVARATDIVEVGGAPIATLVRSATSNSGQVRVAEWSVSSDGMRSPKPDDFLVPIGPNTRVRGVRDPRRFLTNNMLDIDDMSSDDVSTVYEDEIVGARGDTLPVGHDRRMRGILSVTSIIALLAGLLVWWSRRGSNGD